MQTAHDAITAAGETPSRVGKQCAGKLQALFEAEESGVIQTFTLHSIKTDYFWPDEFADIYEAGKMVEYAFNDYNQVRPHSSVMYLPPSEFRRRWESSEEFRVEYAKFLASAKRKTGKYENKIKEVEANGI